MSEKVKSWLGDKDAGYLKSIQKEGWYRQEGKGRWGIWGEELGG